MREIKFRAYWDYWFKKENKEAVKEMIYNWESSREMEDIWFDWWEYYDVMQYTWLKDKNWVEIYEGDIVQYLTGKAIIKFWRWTFECFYNYQWYYWEDIIIRKPIWIDIVYSLERIEVIGNIYENPELLK